MMKKVRTAVHITKELSFITKNEKEVKTNVDEALINIKQIRGKYI